MSDLRTPAFEIITRLDSVDAADQVRALALAFAVVAEAIGTDAHEVLAQAQRMIEQAEGPHTYHVQAIREYAKQELLRHERH